MWYIISTYTPKMEILVQITAKLGTPVCPKHTLPEKLRFYISRYISTCKSQTWKQIYPKPTVVVILGTYISYRHICTAHNLHAWAYVLHPERVPSRAVSTTLMATVINGQHLSQIFASLQVRGGMSRAFYRNHHTPACVLYSTIKGDFVLNTTI